VITVICIAAFMSLWFLGCCAVVKGLER